MRGAAGFDLPRRENRTSTVPGGPGTALAEMLKSNSVLKELDVSSNHIPKYRDGSGDAGDCPGFAQKLAVGVSANGVLEAITFGDEQAVTMKINMAVAAEPGHK